MSITKPTLNRTFLSISTLEPGSYHIRWPIIDVVIRSDGLYVRCVPFLHSPTRGATSLATYFFVTQGTFPYSHHLTFLWIALDGPMNMGERSDDLITSILGMVSRMNYIISRGNDSTRDLAMLLASYNYTRSYPHPRGIWDEEFSVNINQ